MLINIETPKELEEELTVMILKATKQALNLYKKQLESNDWLSLQEACKYANVSNATFQKFRSMGLKVAEIDSVKRVSKKEIDRFLESQSY